MMLNYATMGIILDWSALWLTKDLLVPLYLGGAIIFAFNIGEISARLIASKMIKKAVKRLLVGILVLLQVWLFCIYTNFKFLYYCFWYAAFWFWNCELYCHNI